MKRLTNWLAGILTGVIAYRLWKRQQTPAAATESVAPEPDDRAEELRAKLAETRASDELASEPTEQPAAQPGESLEERRRRVHEEGRSAIDEMHGGEQR
jgi:hypothetical protein